MALFPTVGRNQPHVRVAWYLVVGILCLGVILHLLPFYFMITTSLKSGLETLSNPPTLWPMQLSLAGWRLIFATMSGDLVTAMPEPLYIYFTNSLIMTLGTIILSLPVTSFAAYANSKMQRGRGSRWFFLFCIGTLMLPAAVTLIPSYLLTLNFPFAFTTVPRLPTGDYFPTMRIYDTAWAIILPGVFNAFNFLLFKGFFDTIPNSVLNAARVDGGSEFNIFRRIVLPMSVPVYAVAAWLQFGSVWDNFLWPSLVLQSPDKIPASVAIYQLINSFNQLGSTDVNQAMGRSEQMKQVLSLGLSWNGLMVLGLLQTIPIFIAFIICREYLLKGIRIRGLR